MPWTIKELAEIAGVQAARHSSAVIRGFRAADDAGEGELTFASDSRWLKRIKEGAAVVVPPGLEEAAGDRPLIVADNPRLAFAKIIAAVTVVKRPPAGVDPRAVVEKDATIGPEVSIGPLAYVGTGARIGARTIIRPGAHVAEKAEVGSDCELFPHSYIGPGCRVGNRVILGPGATVGFSGFGYQWDGVRHVGVPQIGIVVIEDDVEIGALSAVDRAMLGETRVGAGAKIDNLVMIGHNCTIGRNVILVAQVGLSGSVTIGDNAILAGQVGVADGVHIGAGAIVAAQSGVAKDIPPGKRWGGCLARDEKTWLRTEVAKDKLPDLLKRMKKLEEKVAKLEKV